jgi:hypothetical protein
MRRNPQLEKFCLRRQRRFLHLGNEMIVPKVCPAVITVTVLQYDKIFRDKRLDLGKVTFV